jgi:hypothetical protein
VVRLIVSSLVPTLIHLAGVLTKPIQFAENRRRLCYRLVDVSDLPYQLYRELLKAGVVNEVIEVIGYLPTGHGSEAVESRSDVLVKMLVKMLLPSSDPVFVVHAFILLVGLLSTHATSSTLNYMSLKRQRSRFFRTGSF